MPLSSREGMLLLQGDLIGLLAKSILILREYMEKRRKEVEPSTAENDMNGAESLALELLKHFMAKPAPVTYITPHPQLSPEAMMQLCKSGSAIELMKKGLIPVEIGFPLLEAEVRQSEAYAKNQLLLRLQRVEEANGAGYRDVTPPKSSRIYKDGEEWDWEDQPEFSRRKMLRDQAAATGDPFGGALD